MLALRILRWTPGSAAAAFLLAACATSRGDGGAGLELTLTPFEPARRACSSANEALLVELPAGRYIRAWIDSEAPVRAAILDHRGNELVFSTARGDDEALLSIAADPFAEYHLSLLCSGAETAEYWLAVQTSAGADATARRALDDALVEALALARSFPGSERARAAPLLERLVLEGSTIGDEFIERRATHGLADLLLHTGRLKDAADLFGEVIASSNVDSGPVLMDALVGAGIAAIRTSAPERTKVLAAQALELSRRLGDRRREANAEVAMGLALQDSGELAAALERHQAARVLFEQAGASRGVTTALIQEGFALSDLSQEHAAIERLEHALALARSQGDSDGEALALLALGHAHSKLGAKQEALRYYGRTTPLLETWGDPYWSAALFGGLGFVYEELGDWEQASAYYRRALALNEEVSSLWGQSVMLTGLGRAQRALGRLEEGRAYHEKALLVSESLSDPRTLAFSLTDMGDVLVELREHATAQAYYDRALRLSREGGFERHEVDVLTRLARIHAGNDERETANAYLTRALMKSRRIDFVLGEARALLASAELERVQGSLDRSVRRAEEALALVERLRLAVSSRRLRMSFFDSVRALQELHIDTLMELHRVDPLRGYSAAAFVASEAARARSLSEILSTIASEESAEPTWRRQRIEALETRLGVLSAQRETTRGSEIERPDEGPVSSEVRAVLAELDYLESEGDGPNSGASAELPYAPASLERLQAALDSDTALLSYQLGIERSFVWVLTRDGLDSHELPPRARVQAAAGQVYSLLLPPIARVGETPKQVRLRARERERRFWEAASSLSEALLGPVKRSLTGRRLIVVGDGILHQIPFSALPIPGEARVIPLVTRYEVVRLPSATILPLLRARSEARPSPLKALAVVADPVFNAGDPRVQGKPLGIEPVAGDAWGLSQALRDVALTSDAQVPRLLASRQEASAISELVPDEERYQALGFDASRELTASGILADYRIVHFATHGILDAKHPSLSGIILSLIDDEGRPQNGFLRLHELYDLELPVDLVVLSACSTALGKESRAEGLIGLVRGFLSSGASGVIASYWNVDDGATAELMERFYTNMFTASMDPAAALRGAQLSMWQEKRWQSPFFWAAFELHGDWTS